MRTVRQGIWETNSSSTHTITFGSPEHIISSKIFNSDSLQIEEGWQQLQKEFEETHIFSPDLTLDFPYGESERDYMFIIAKTTIGKLNIIWASIVQSINTYDLPVDKMLEQPLVQAFCKVCKEVLYEDFKLELHPRLGNPFRWNGKYTQSYAYATIYISCDSVEEKDIPIMISKGLTAQTIVVGDEPYSGFNEFTNIKLKVI